MEAEASASLTEWRFSHPKALGEERQQMLRPRVVNVGTAA